MEADDNSTTTHYTEIMPGFRFHPTEQELVGFYLRRRVEGNPIACHVIPQVELYRFEPWELRDVARTCEKEWFFFVPRDTKCSNGGRPNRRTKSGFWKATGTDRRVQSERCNYFGLKKTLVYYKGRAPHGIKTEWVMNEYRLGYRNCNSESTKENLQDSVTLCRIYPKGAPLRLNMAMHGMAAAANLNISDLGRQELVQKDTEVSIKLEQCSLPPSPESDPPKGLLDDTSTFKLPPQLLRLSSFRRCALNSHIHEEIDLQFHNLEPISADQSVRQYSSGEGTPTSSSCITSCLSAWGMEEEEGQQQLHYLEDRKLSLFHCDSAKICYDQKDNPMDMKYLQEIDLWSYCTDLYDRELHRSADDQGYS